jgi:phosphatidylinositol alpha-1,6-mannosyltransferase
MQAPSRRALLVTPPAVPNSLLIVSYNFPPQLGGIEQLCVQLARALHQLGIEVHVITKAQPGAERFDADEPYTVHRYRKADVGMSRVVAGLLRHGHDRVLCMQWTSALWLATSRAVMGRPRTLGIMVHGKELYPSPASPFPHSVQRAALRRVMRGASHLLPNSSFTAGLLRQQVTHDNVWLVPLGVDASRFSSASSASEASRWRQGHAGPVVSTLARLVPRKGVDTLLRALPELLQTHPTLQCVVAGEGPDAPRLAALARELGVASHVEFVGRLPEHALTAFYAASDVFVLLSRLEAEGRDVEGFGLVLLEAQAAGCPVVTTREGGMPDALVPERTGLLVDAHDPHAVAHTLAGLLADAPRRQTMGQAAVEYARTRSWQATARRVLAALEHGDPRPAVHP